MAPLLHKEITDQILASFYEVYGEHGYGFGESIYSRSLVVEYQIRGLETLQEVKTEVVYKGVSVGFYRADIVVVNKVLVEVKANQSLTEADERQVLNYLKATGLEVGMLLNFGPKPIFRRMVFSRPPRISASSGSSA